MPSRHHVLIIGGTGFIGSYLTKRLSMHAAYTVSVIHSSPLTDIGKEHGVAYYRMNLLRPHQIPPELSSVDVMVIGTQPNETVMKNIIALAHASASLRKILYLSTYLVYPSAPSPQTESVIPAPSSPYEKGKMMEENVLSDFSRTHGCTICIARLGNVYGDVKNKGIVAHLVTALLRNDPRAPVIINGSGEQKRDYIFVEDVVHFLSRLISHDHEFGDIFNICNGIGYTIKDLLSLLELLSGRNIHVHHGPPLPEKQSVIGDNHKLLHTIGDIPRLTIAQGLRKTLINYHYPSLTTP